MMVFLRYDVSEEGVLALARRYAGPRAMAEYFDRCDRGETDGEAMPVPVEFLGDRWRRGGPTVRDVLAAQGLLPDASVEVFTALATDVRGAPRIEQRPVPVASDLDARGRCRCGCWYQREPAAPLASVDVPRLAYDLEVADERGRIVLRVPIEAADRLTAERAAALMLPDAEAQGWAVSVRDGGPAR